MTRASIRTKRDGGLIGELVRFQDRIRACGTLDQCADLFREAIAAHGFEAFAIGEVDLAHRERTVFYIIDWPERWRSFYLRSGLVDHDPILEELKSRTEPFTWSQLMADGKMSKAGREALRLVVEHGWTEGLAVPLPRSAARLGLVSMVGRCPPLDRESRAVLSSMAMWLHEQARCLTPRLGVEVALCRLTQREIDSLRLVVQGATDAVIAARLGIARSTAHEHVESAKRKLKAGSRATAVAVALSLGLVSL